jgi:hypothetical protein
VLMLATNETLGRYLSYCQSVLVSLPADVGHFWDQPGRAVPTLRAPTTERVGTVS